MLLMTFRMRIGSTTWRRVMAGAIPVAFAAALPLVQWCPLGADVTLRDCLPGGAWAAQAAAAAACANEHAGCGAREAAGGGCPFQHTTPRTRCIGAPMGGPGLRPLAPDVHPPDLLLALPAMEPPEPCAPREIGWIGLEPEARPPTRAPATRPPVRGPPLA